MKTIVDDPEDFLEQNGWAFISPDDVRFCLSSEIDITTGYAFSLLPASKNERPYLLGGQG